jgi:hypothetical protein
LTDLILVDLDYNSLVGPLPTELGNLSKLEFLLLNRNVLTGDIPAEFSGLGSLRLAFLDHNSLSGSLDNNLCELATFNESPEDADGTEMLIADCIVACECCTSCCTDDSDTECNTFTQIPSQDPYWEAGKWPMTD